MIKSINKTKAKMVEKNLIDPFSLNKEKMIKTIAKNTHLETISFRLNTSGNTIIVRISKIAIHKACEKIRRSINRSLPLVYKSLYYLLLKI